MIFAAQTTLAFGSNANDCKDIAPFRGNDWSGGSVGLLSYKVKTMTAFAKTKAAFAKTQATFNKTQTSFDTFLNKPVIGHRENKGHAVIR